MDFFVETDQGPAGIDLDEIRSEWTFFKSDPYFVRRLDIGFLRSCGTVTDSDALGLFECDAFGPLRRLDSLHHVGRTCRALACARGQIVAALTNRSLGQC